MKQQIILTLRKWIVIVALLSHTTGLWAQWWDTIYITAPSGQTLMCQRYIGPTFTRYTLIGDTSIAGNLTVPHTIIWPYTDSDGYTHYPTYIVSDLSFRNCHNLLSVAIQEGYTYISNSFEGCTNLTTVTLPSTMTSITGDAFKNCHALQTINIPNGVTTIGRGSFEGCASLESISLPNSITTLGARAFAGCTSLTNIVIPPLIDSVYGGTFHNCSSLQSVTLPDSLRTIGNYEFYYGSEAPLYHTREVGTFEGCTALTSIVLPNKLKHIWNYSFLGCTNLSSVTFPDSLERIGSLAFSECGLTNLILPSNLFQLDYGVFSRCINLQEVTISPQIRNIGSATFDSCVNLTTVNFNADSCFQGGEYCFSVGSSTCCLEGRVWHNCPNLTQVNIGNNVRYLMSNLFYDLTSLTSITIPPSVRKIAYGTFVGCTGLSTVNLNADSVNYHSLGSSGSPFIGCSNLSTLNIGNNVTIIPPNFMYGVSSLNNINLPESIRTICHSAFYGCSTGQSVLIIPNSVDSIAESAFRYCNFDTLVLGSSLRHIGSDAFVNNSIEAIFINAATPPFIYNEDNSNYYHNPSFSYDDFDNTELFVPCGLIGTYQASFWGAFENINSTRPELTVNTDGHGTVESLYDSVCTNGTTSILGIPEMGYVFSHWSDGDTTNPRTIVLTQDTSLTAYFTELPFNCSGVTLPYTSNFTQCWTSDGGAIIIDSGHVKLNGEGQNTTSPWIHVSDSADLYLKVQTSGYSQGNAPTIECFILSSNGETRTTTWIINNNGLSSSMSLGTEYTGQSIQIGLTYLGTDTTTIFLTDVTLFQFGATVEISAPTIAYVGDTVVFAAQTSLPDGDYGLYVPYWYFFTQDWGTIPTGTIETTDYQRDTVKVVWSAPGEYIADFGYTVWNAYNGYPVYGQARQMNITILDTTSPVPVSCDSIILPYTADFTQCWAVEGGASIIDATHTSLTSQGQRLVGPWMESTPGNSFFHFVYHCDDNHEWNSNQTVRITLENEDGVIVSWEDQIGNWGGRYRFDSPGGPIRASFEYTGSQSCSEFVVSDVAVYSYQIDVRLEAPAIATAGDTITLTAHATLQNGDMPDSYSWYMYDANWNYYWLSPESGNLGTVATVLSCSDSNLVMVINTTGRYPITTNIYKNMVYNNHDAYDDDRMYINIIDQSIYQEDSIYYTSAAKDTVIGCHPQLHVANLPEGVTVIADSAFFNHGSLSSVTLPHSLTHIGKCAFALTNGFSEITIPENVIFVGDNAFWSCLGLNTVNFNATNCQTMSPSTASDGSYWPVFIGCDNLTTFNIGENVTRIPDRAFSNCRGPRGTLVIPDAVTYIGVSAFYHWIDNWDWDHGSTWDTFGIVLGAGLTEIGDFAFGCPRGHLTSVVSRNPVPPAIHEQTFYRYGPEYTPMLTVPCGSVEAYHAAEHWDRILYIKDTCGNETNVPILNVNNINTTVYPLGYLGYDGSVTNFLVNGSLQSTLFANGLWIGSGEHTAVRQFGSSGDDFQPGPLSNDGQPMDGDDYNRVWFVSRSMIDYHLAHYTEPGYTPAESIRTWPAEDANVGHSLAPYHDANNDGHYNPLDGDYPLIRGDKAAFSIFNDAGTHGESGGQALGVEVHCMTYAFHEPADTAMMNTVFVHYDIYNRSSNTYENTYVGMWSDFDIGYAHDDYMGCDVSQGMYYAYNGDENDGPGAGSFNGIPPSQGCVILGGPWQQPDGLDNASIDNDAWYFTPGDTLGNQAINGLGFGNSIVDDERMGMTNFTYYENSMNSINGAPSQAGHFYNYLRSTWRNGQHVKYGGNGINYGTSDLDCSYMFPGDSDPWHWGTDGSVPDVNPDDWNEVTVGNAPGDRRGLGSCGPFTFHPSATETECQQLDVAYVTGWSQTSVSQAVENLKRNVASVRRQFAHNTTDSGRPFLYQPSTVGIADIADTQSLLVYPNPTTGLLNVVLNDGESGEVKLFDMMGRTLLSQHVEGSAVLDLHTLPQGVYMVKIGNSIARKILIIK